MGNLIPGARPVTPDIKLSELTIRTPSVASVAVEFPPNRHSQDEVIGALADFAGPEFQRFAAKSGVATRHLALPLSRYRKLSGFTEANDAYLDIALELGERSLKSALAQAEIEPSEVDVVFSTTVTGLTVPSLEARLATRLGFRPDVKRVPLFGLGCVAGAAGMARVHDYLRAFPSHVAALLAVELCSLTIQRDDHSIANLVVSSLFGDGAAAVIATGADRPAVGPKLIATRSRTYPDTEDVLGWNIGTAGIPDRPVGRNCHGGREIPGSGHPELPRRPRADHRGYLKMGSARRRPEGDRRSRKCGRRAAGCIRYHSKVAAQQRKSVVSFVLDILQDTMTDPPPPGSFGLMIAMGPGFSAELVLLSW